MHSISIDPYFTVTGVVHAGGGELPADVEDRLSSLLADRRLIAAVMHDPRRQPDHDVLFSLVCDADLRTLRVGKSGKILVGKLLRNLEHELAESLGHDVSLTQDVEVGHELFYEDPTRPSTTPSSHCEAAVGKDANSEDAEATGADGKATGGTGANGTVTGTDVTDSTVVSIETAHDTDLDYAAFAAHEFTDPRLRVHVFSRRGLSLGAPLSWLARSEVTVGALQNWSVFRFDDTHYTEVPEADPRELPSIEVVVARHEERGTAAAPWAYVTVTGADGDLQSSHTVYPTEAAHRRPVLQPDWLKPGQANPTAADAGAVSPTAANPAANTAADGAARADAAGTTGTTSATGRTNISNTTDTTAERLLAAVTNPHVSDRSEANALVTALTGTTAVNPDAVHAALSHEFDGELEARLIALITALGVPDGLVAPAISGGQLPHERKFAPRRVLQTLLTIGDLGYAGFDPRGASPKLLARIENAIRARPFIGYSLVAVEAALGVALLRSNRRGRRRRGGLRAFGGVLLITDAIFDAVVLARRARNRTR